MSDPYDGPDLKTDVQGKADDRKPEENLVVPQEGILEGDPVNASTFARDILASVVDEVVRRSKMAPADNAYRSGSCKTSERRDMSEIPHSLVEREASHKSLERTLRRDDRDDSTSNDSFVSIAENDSKSNLGEYYSASEMENVRDLNVDPKTGIVCFRSLESLGSLKEFPDRAKVLLNMLSRRAMETPLAKNTKPQGIDTDSLKGTDDLKMKGEEVASHIQKANAIFSRNTNVSSSIGQTDDNKEENKSLDIPWPNKKNSKEIPMGTNKAKMIFAGSTECKEKILEGNHFKEAKTKDIAMKMSLGERTKHKIASKEVEDVNVTGMNTERSSNVKQPTSEPQEAFADAQGDTAEIKASIIEAESVVTDTTQVDNNFKKEDIEIKEETTERDAAEDDTHEDTPTDVKEDTSGAREESPDDGGGAASEVEAETTVRAAPLNASDNAPEERTAAPGPPRPGGGAAALKSPRPFSVGARRTSSSTPPPPPLVAELTRHSPSAEQLRVALAKEFSNSANHASNHEYDLFWSTVGLLRRYEDPMRPTSSQGQPARAADEDEEDSGEEDEELAAAIDAIDALFPGAELDEDEEDDEDDLEVPYKRIVLQRDDDEGQHEGVHPTLSFRKVVSVPSHSAATSISKPLVSNLPSPPSFIPEPVRAQEKKTFKKRLRKIFSNPFGKKKARTT